MIIVIFRYYFILGICMVVTDQTKIAQNTRITHTRHPIFIINNSILAFFVNDLKLVNIRTWRLGKVWWG